MVNPVTMRALRLLLLPALVLPLASCFIFFSAFPPTLTQVTARTDLSALVPAATAGDYEAYAVAATFPSYVPFVFLFNRNGSSDPRVVVLDANLNLIQSYTGAWLSGYGMSGWLIMGLAEGNIEIGNLGFSAANLTLIGAGPSWVNLHTIFTPSFATLLFQRNDMNFNISGGNTLTYSQYFWTSNATTPSDFIPDPTLPIKSVADTQFEVAGVWSVEDSLTVILVLREYDNDVIHVLSLPLNDVFGNTLSAPLFDYYPHASFDNIDTSSVGFAGDCLVAYSYRDRALVRISLSPPFDVIQTLPVGQNPHRVSTSYMLDGSFSVQFDKATRVLTKVEKWW
jgi:hypothetical protein